MRELTIRNNQRNAKLFRLYDKLQKESKHPDNSRDVILERALDLVIRQSADDPEYFKRLAEINLDLTDFEERIPPMFMHLRVQDEQQFDIAEERIRSSFDIRGAVKKPFMLRLVLTAYYFEERKKKPVDISESPNVNTERMKKAIEDLIITLAEIENVTTTEVLESISREIKGFF